MGESAGTRLGEDFPTDLQFVYTWSVTALSLMNTRTAILLFISFHLINLFLGGYFPNFQINSIMPSQ
jgi:hypothetical protein